MDGKFEKEQSFEVEIEKIEKILEKNYMQKGSAEKALLNLKKLLDAEKKNSLD